MKLDHGIQRFDVHGASSDNAPHQLRDSPALQELFEAVISAAEAAWDMHCSILLLDPVGSKLHHAAAPSLPKAYAEAIDGVSIGPSVGSCGTAAFTAELVIVEDIESDPLWADFKSLALMHELRACWSVPILSSSGKVLGTFACYFSHCQRPDQRQLTFIEAAGKTLAVAIEQRQLQHVITQLSHFDALTGLWNRRAFKQHLHEQLQLGVEVALLFIDLDLFKDVNDTLGHEAGDILLQKLSTRFSSVVADRGVLSRIGGDEFTVVLSDEDCGACAE